jgi:hypothetical protein
MQAASFICLDLNGSTKQKRKKNRGIAFFFVARVEKKRCYA